MFSRHIRSLLALLLFSGVACTDGSSQTNDRTADQTAFSVETSPGETQQGTTRRLWVTSGWELVNWWINMSPDGKRVVFSDDGGVGVRDLETGTTIPLTTDLYTEQPLFSPDGSQVAFAACCEPGYSLRIGPSDRAASRVLFSEVQGADWEDRSIGGEMVPLDWSPDGKSILVSFNYAVPARNGVPAHQEYVIVEASVEDGRYRVLGDRPGESPKYFASRQGEEPAGRVKMRNPKYSPDGRFIAFGRPVDVGGSSDHLYTLRLADHTEIDLRVEARVIGWSADGSGLFYGYYASDGAEIWFLPVRDGAASGAPRRIRSGLPTGPGWVQGDRFFYIVDAEFPGLHTATVDVSAGRVLSPPTRVPEEEGLGDWSPNGQQMAFESARDRETRRGTFVVRSVAGNNRREFAAPEGSNRIDWVRWMRGSNAIVAEIRMPIDPTSTKTPRHIMRLDLETGRYTDLGPARLRNGAAEFAGDGSLLYTVTRGGIVAVDLGRHSAGDGLGRGEGAACDAGWPMDLGDCRTVYSPPAGDQTCPIIAALDLSPDEGEIVAASDGCILRVPTRGGTARVIHREVGIDNSSVQWTPDGNHILFIRSGAGQNADELRVIPASGGEARTLFSYPNLGGGVRIHPDGRRIMFFGGEVREELWVLEDLPGFGR